MEFKIVRVCTGTGTYSVAPSEKVLLDLRRIAERFKGRVRSMGEHALIIQDGEVEVSVYRSGRLLVKNAKDEEEARLMARRIYEE